MHVCYTLIKNELHVVCMSIQEAGLGMGPGYVWELD